MLRSVRLNPSDHPPSTGHPFDLPALRGVEEIELRERVTFLVMVSLLRYWADTTVASRPALACTSPTCHVSPPRSCTTTCRRRLA